MSTHKALTMTTRMPALRIGDWYLYAGERLRDGPYRVHEEADVEFLRHVEPRAQIIEIRTTTGRVWRRPPQRSARPIVAAAGSPAPPRPTSDGDAIGWLLGRGDRTAALIIWAVMMGRKSADYPDVPYDPDDFGQCHRLLELMPSWRARLPEVAAMYPEWAAFVRAWPELTEMFQRVVGQRPGAKWNTAASQMCDRLVVLLNESNQTVRKGKS